MDDIRRPYRGERRSYVVAQHRRPTGQASPVDPVMPAACHQPLPAADQTSPSIPRTQPLNHQPYRHSAELPSPVRPPAPHAKQRPIRPIQLIAVIGLAAAAMAGGYLLLKPNTPKTFTPASLARQSSFSFYFPNPLPQGYSYVNKINTFQSGQAYYMLANNKKHIIVREQTANGRALETSALSNPVSYPAAGGKAAIGSLAGQPAGLVLTNNTLITLNSTGTVPAADIAAAINYLKPVTR